VNGWGLEEDEMLKAKLAGITVTDQRADPDTGRPVKVWFRFPEAELREVTYPFITIDLIGISEALDRAHRGGQVRPTVASYHPPDDEFTDPAPGRVLVTEWPIAMNLDYQVTTWARNIHHDRAMTGQLWVKFPGRYGSIGGSVTPFVRARSCQLLGWTPGDRIDDAGKRLFRKMYTIRVFSELWAAQIRDVVQISTIDISVPSLFGSEDNWGSVINCME